MPPAAIIGLLATGIGMQAYGQYQAGKSAEKQAKAEAAWHAYNAEAAKKEEEAERQATAFEATQQRRVGKQVMATLRARRGATGVEMAGSPLLVAEDTAGQLALENAMIRMTGARRAARWRSQSILDIGKADMAGMRGTAARRAGTIGAGASLLSGAGMIGYTGYRMGTWGQSRGGQSSFGRGVRMSKAWLSEPPSTTW